MELRQKLLDKIRPYGIKEKKVLFVDFDIKKLSLPQIKQSILSEAQILDFNENDGSITVAVKEGKLRMNEAVISMFVFENHMYLAAYAQEGLISQHTSEKAVKRIRDIIEKI